MVLLCLPIQKNGQKYGGESLAGVASCKKWVFENFSVTSVTFLNMPIHGIVPLPTDYDALIKLSHLLYLQDFNILQYGYNMDNISSIGKNYWWYEV